MNNVCQPLGVEFMIGDFRDLWNAMASRTGEHHRGNYLFAVQLALLWKCVTQSGTRARLIHELVEIDERYRTFVPLLDRWAADPLGIYWEDPDDRETVGITGAGYGRSLDLSTPRLGDHLRTVDHVLKCRTDQLFLDLVRALESAGLYTGAVTA